MAFGSITSWQIEGETVETVIEFIFFVSKITADSDCIHEIKKHLLLRRKAMTNLDRILKIKDKGEKERYTHLNAEFQRITRRDKKAFLSNQCNIHRIIEKARGFQKNIYFCFIDY